jgi:hypothetical protein
MTRLHMFLGPIAGALTLILTLGALAYFWAEDGCLDAGGAVINGLCHSDAGIAPLSYSFTALGWAILFFLALIPALVAYWVARKLIRAFQVHGNSAA